MTPLHLMLPAVLAWGLALAARPAEPRPPGPRPQDPPQEPAPQEPAPQADASPATPDSQRLTQSQTLMRVDQYRRGEHWALRGLVLLSLGPDYHPDAAAILLDALEAKDPHLRVYALEALARTEPGALRSALTTELVDELIRGQLRAKDERYQELVGAVLRAAFPGCSAEDRKDWEQRWKSEGEQYTPEPWIDPEVVVDGRSTAGAAFERALDLYEAGLEVVICIDSTGSMQPTIDAAAAALDDLVAMLQGLAPDFRIGLVHYKDRMDLGAEGAAVLERLQKRPDDVRERLAEMTAYGGGDAPERVEGGLRLALDPREMKWRRHTNKLVVVIGDAPCHANALDEAVALARDAFRTPFGVEATPVRPAEVDGRSRTRPVRPFVTSCIGVGAEGVADSTREHFQAIAAAGGGTYAELSTSKRGSNPRDEVVGHVLKLSFGAQYEDSLDAFVEVFFTWHRRGLFD